MIIEINRIAPGAMHVQLLVEQEEPEEIYNMFLSGVDSFVDWFSVHSDGAVTTDVLRQALASDVLHPRGHSVVIGGGVE